MQNRAIDLALPDCVAGRCDGQGRFHPGVDRVADDLVRPHVLDRAEVDFALIGAMLGDVGQPQLVRACRGEVPLDMVVVDGRAGFAPQAAFLREHGPEPLLGAQPPDPVLARLQASLLEFVADEPVAERGVVLVGVPRRVGQVSVVPITLRDGVSEPLIEGLFGEAQYPAGHRDGDTVDGQFTDQRVHHFGLTSRER